MARIDLHTDRTWGPYSGILQSEGSTADKEKEVRALTEFQAGPTGGQGLYFSISDVMTMAMIVATVPRSSSGGMLWSVRLGQSNTFNIEGEYKQLLLDLDGSWFFGGI